MGEEGEEEEEGEGDGYWSLMITEAPTTGPRRVATFLFVILGGRSATEERHAWATQIHGGALVVMNEAVVCDGLRARCLTRRFFFHGGEALLHQ